MKELPADIPRVLEHISRRIEQLESSGQPEKCDQLRRVAALLQRGDFPRLTHEECDLLAEWRGANRALRCLTDHRRLILDKWLSACRLRLSSGTRKITEDQYEEWRTWLVANSGEPRTPAPPSLPFVEGDDRVETVAVTRAGGEPLGVETADLGPGGDRVGQAPAAAGRGCDVPSRESSMAMDGAGVPRGHKGGDDGPVSDVPDRIAATPANPQGAPVGPVSNIPDRITAPPELLKPAIAELVGRIPDTWQAYRPDDLTKIRAQALFLLTAAGMVERRERLRLRMADHPVEVEATLQATGEYGIVEAMEPLAAHLWSDWADAFNAWTEGQTRGTSPLYCERLEPAEWRLTDQGVLARQDLVAGQSGQVTDFVLKLGFFDGRPRLLPDGRTTRRQAVRGAGSLVRMKKLQGQTIVAASAGVGELGAEAFVRALMGMFGALQANAAGSPPAPGARVGADRESRKQALAEKILAAQKILNGGTQEWTDLLPVRVKHAYGQYLSALPNVKDNPTDRDCYDWAVEHNEGSRLPAFDTWQRYVRQARQHYGQQKNTPLAGRDHGPSIARAEDLEPPETDGAD